MKINKVYPFIWIATLTSTLFLSCIDKDKNTFFYTSLENETWPSDSIIVFDIKDLKKGNYNVLLEVIFNRDYAYQSLAIGSIIEYDTIKKSIEQNILLKNDYGQMDKGGMYRYFQKNDTLIKNIDLPDSINNIKINLIHTFDTDIKGINKLGIQLVSDK